MMKKHRKWIVAIIAAIVGCILFSLAFDAYKNYRMTLPERIADFVARADSQMPSGAEMIIWKEFSGESGGGYSKLTLWPDGRSEVEVLPGPISHERFVREPEDGWIEKVERYKALTRFIRNAVYTKTDAQERFREAFRLGIHLLEPVKSDYVIMDGSGVRIVVQINGVTEEQTISDSPLPKSYTENYIRFKALCRLLGEFSTSSGYKTHQVKAANKPDAGNGL